MPSLVNASRPLALEREIGGRTTSEWVDVIAGKALGALLLLVGGVLVWLLGRVLIRAVTRSIETGLPLNRKARKALSRARIMMPQVSAQEEQLAIMRRQQRAGTIRNVLQSALAAVLAALVGIMILELAGLPVAPLLASAGIVGVALGFGAQSLVKDLLSGMFMLIEDQYGVGDIVDLGEATGAVEEVGLRSTRLRSLDGTVWYVPNGEVRRVGNMTKMWSRALIEVRFAYDTDLDKARQAMLDALTAARTADPEVEAAILSEPEVPGIEAFDYDAVVVRLMVNVAPTTQWTVMRAAREEMRRVFAERGIAMATPDHTLYLDATHPANRGPEGGESTS
jgi:small conductance mechanosensitive channel